MEWFEWSLIPIVIGCFLLMLLLVKGCRAAGLI